VSQPKDKSGTPPPPAKSGRNRTLIIALAVAAVVAVALIAGSLLLTGGDDDNEAATTTSSSTTTTGGSTPAAVSLLTGIPQHGTTLGNHDATVRLIQFEDLQCPICKQYTDNAFSAIVDEYVRPGRITVDFRGLAFLGPDSLKALKIAVAAGNQNKLWEVVGLFYENQGPENSGWVTEALIDQILSEVPGLDAAKVKADALTPAVSNKIAAFQAEANRRGVQGTPAFFLARGINQPIPLQPGAYTPSEFRPAIDQALKGS
jgi:protein-disulfide isomerase